MPAISQTRPGWLVLVLVLVPVIDAVFLTLVLDTGN
jgi:hypothetical protein